MLTLWKRLLDKFFNKYFNILQFWLSSLEDGIYNKNRSDWNKIYDLQREGECRVIYIFDNVNGIWEFKH